MTIPELKAYLSKAKLPKEARISDCEVVTDVAKFISAQLATIEKYQGLPDEKKRNICTMPYRRLLKLK